MSNRKNNPFASFEHLEGFTSLDSEQIIKVKMSDHHGFVSPVQFANGGTSAMSTLAKFNIVPLPETRAQIMAAVSRITEFAEGAYIARPGSTPPYFALQDGTVFHPNQVESAEAIFPRTTKHLVQSGSLKQWKRYVAEPLIGNPRAQAMLAMPFAAVIAELFDAVGNVGFEVVGAPATGKSTGLKLAASVMGGAVDRQTSYMVSMNATANGMEAIVPLFKNTLLVLEEGQLFSASDTPKMKATKWREFGHRLADGTSKLRGQYDGSDAVPTTSTPLWFLLNSNEPLAEVLGGGDTDADRAVLQRIQTLPANGEYGLFDQLPAGMIGGAAFADSLQAAMRRYHGTAIRAFLPGLLERRHADEAALRKRIASYMNEFVGKVCLDPDDGEAARAAKAFGLLYPAIRLAQYLDVLPTSWDALKVSLRCHALNREAVLHRRPFKARLQSYASRRDLVHLERGNFPTMSDDQVRASPGFIKKRGGETRLLMSVQAYRRAFPDWKRLEDVASKFCERDRDGVHHPKQIVRADGAKLRMVTFLM